MAVEPASASASASSSNAQAAPTPGVRATTATTVIRKASEKVVGSINLKAMEQSFPDFLESEEDRQFIQLLTEKTGEHLSTGFEEAWGDLMTNSEYKDFTAKANQVDQVFAAATQRRARREPPQDAWKKGADPVVAIAAAVIPKLQGHLDSLRATSAELSEQAVTRQRAILDRQGEADAVEREITAMLRSIQEGAKNLSSIDQSALRQLSDSLIPLIRSDEL